MTKTRINCPQCRQPIVADINQLFDAGVDPNAKQMILSGQFNLAQCPNCGYQGNLATPLVYHDPEKELLLTYFPPELGLPINEQERVIGPLITQATNNLPMEKRKAYLLRPQTMFTLQTLVERVLEADGITKEMIQAQQKKLALLQRLLGATDEAVAEIVKTEDQLLDSEFFNLLSRLGEASVMSGDKDSAARLGELQQKLLQHSTFGQQIQNQNREVEAAVQTLQQVGRDLTREKLLDLFIDAPNDTRLSVMVSLTRQGLDYEFFQLLSGRIDQAEGEQREKLLRLREKLLEITRAVDQQLEARTNEARKFLEELLTAPDVTEATRQNIGALDEFFMRMLDEEMQAARKAADLERISKLQKIVNVLEEASQPTAELQLIEQLLGAENETALEKLLQENQAVIADPQFMETLTALVAQLDSSQDQPAELKERIQQVFEAVLRFSMKTKM